MHADIDHRTLCVELALSAAENVRGHLPDMTNAEVRDYLDAAIQHLREALGRPETVEQRVAKLDEKAVRAALSGIIAEYESPDYDPAITSMRILHRLVGDDLTTARPRAKINVTA